MGRIYTEGVIGMKYYAKYDAKGNLVAVGKNLLGVEITVKEYNRLLTEIREKAALVDSLYNGEITIDSVPAQWQEEIQRRVSERIAAEGEAAQQEISADEALNIILGGEDA